MTNYTRIKETHNESDYISVNGFKKSRKKSNLKELLYFYIDLDIICTPLYELIYNQYEDHLNIEDKINDKYVMMIKKHCKNNSLPEPSIINFSGNGYHLYWTIKEHSKADYFKKFYGASDRQIKAYELIEKELVKLFKPFGADSKATDSARLLRQTGTINPKNDSYCKTIYKSKTKVEFSYFADVLLPYSYEEVKEYKKITKKQKEFLLKNNIVKKSKLNTLDKFSAKKLIEEYIQNDRQITEKQRAYLIKLGVSTEEIKELNIKQANDLIRSKSVSKNANFDYVYNILEELYRKKRITKGNRAIFYFYFGIASSRVELTQEQAIDKAMEYNKTLDLSEKELIHHVKSGRRNSVNKNIKKDTIYSDLNIDKTSLKKRSKRTTKDKVNAKYEQFKECYDDFKKKSIRQIAEELKISKSTVSNFKKKLKEEKDKIKIKKEQAKEKFNKFLSEKSPKKVKIETPKYKRILTLRYCPQNE